MNALYPVFALAVHTTVRLRRFWAWLTKRSVGGRVDGVGSAWNRQAHMRFNDPEEVWEHEDFLRDTWRSLITGEVVTGEELWRPYRKSGMQVTGYVEVYSEKSAIRYGLLANTVKPNPHRDIITMEMD